MRIQTKLTLKVALATGGLLMVGTGSASAAETVNPDGPDSPVDQLVADAGMPSVADTIHGAPDDLQAAPGVDPVQALTTTLVATPQQRPAPALVPAAVLHAVPLHLLQHDLTPSAEVSGDVPEPDLNAPLGSELAATDLPALPVLPATAPLTATPDTLPATDLPVLPAAAPLTPDTLPARAATPPADGELPVLPLHGSISTQPLDPTAGTRVTGLHTAAAPTDKAQPPAPIRPPAMPAHDQRTDQPAAGLPLLGGLLPSTNGVLRTPLSVPALNGVSGVTQPASLTRLTQQGPGALVESAAKLLRK
jgi:hypothetical protein